MNRAVQNAVLGAASMLYLSFATDFAPWTGALFAMASYGACFAWYYHPSRRAQPRVRLRVEDVLVPEKLRKYVDGRVKELGLPYTSQCYDYGGCQWRGDGCAGRPLAWGSGGGCPHSSGKRCLDEPNDAGNPR